MSRYSYSQPSQSEQDQSDTFVYPPQTEVEFGFQQTCYCGNQPKIATSTLEPGRRYYTCGNADDGECHVWKWWEDAVMEEMRATQRHTLQLAEKVDGLTFSCDYETAQNLLRLENMVVELVENKSRSRFDCFVAVMVMVLIFIGILLTLI
ncbi:hypothetical protein Bca4012_036218 [Brassica carinata]